MKTDADLEFVKSAATNPLLVVRFVKEPDLFLVLCADTEINEETKESNLIGITMWGLRKSRGPSCYALKEDLVPTIFKPRLIQKSETEYLLQIEPLTETITILKRTSQYTCLYPFKTEKKAGVIQDIVVEYTATPLTMAFTVHATHKANKNALPSTLVTKIQCPDEFTNRLYDFFMKEEKDQ